MAYFRNGTEAERFEEEWCGYCIHYDDPDIETGIPTKDPCPVWLLHLLWSYEQDVNDDEEDTPAAVKRAALSAFIPDSENEKQCRMFAPKEAP